MSTHAHPRPGSSLTASQRPERDPVGTASADEAWRSFDVTDRSASLGTRLTLGISRALWSHRAETWAEDGSVGLRRVVDAIISEACEPCGGIAVDLGCGSGQVTLPLARLYSGVLAVDIDAGAIDLLRTRAAAERSTNIEGIVHPLETLELAAGSVDLIVSNYAMHHLRDADKRELLERSFAWLRPGGRLVIGDMMFGRGATGEDRQIIRQKVGGLLGRGPAGWWRILKNSGRFLLRFQEKPLRPSVWQSMVLAAGFEDQRMFHVVAEAHVISATKPRPGVHGQ